jgi:oligopeptide transport system permease protein
MALWLAKRLGFALLAWLALLTIAFFLLRAAPGGPFDTERALPPEAEAALAARFELNAPLHAQYAGFLWRLLHGDFGPSLSYPDFTVTELITSAAPLSFAIGFAAFVLALIGGVALGVAAGAGGVLGRILEPLTTVLLAVPNFVIAPLLVLVFALGLNWLPAGGADSISAMVLPTIALALPLLASVAVLTLNGISEARLSDAAQLHRAFGLSYWGELRAGALKLALLPVIAYLSGALAQLLTGSVIIEQVFGLPGLGRHFVLGALNRDYTLLLGVIALFGALILLLQVIADLLLRALDPRVRV